MYKIKSMLILIVANGMIAYIVGTLLLLFFGSFKTTSFLIYFTVQFFLSVVLVIRFKRDWFVDKEKIERL